uniref:ABC transporter family G domain-containing protein n=2 Tax=Lotharella globosa TaxID=91324 RepID=A0A7S3YMK7_9EUKA
MVGARVFSGDILVIKREGNAGVSTLLQGVIKLLVDLIGVILYSSIFAGTWIPLGHPGEAQDWFALCISLGVAASGVGSAVSLAIDRDNSLLVATVLSLCFAAFCGVYPRYKSLNNAQWFWDLFYSRWAAEATYTLYTAHLDEQGQDIQRGADEIGFTIGRFGFDLGIMWVLGFAYRVIALIVLEYEVHGGVDLSKLGRRFQHYCCFASKSKETK